MNFLIQKAKFWEIASCRGRILDTRFQSGPLNQSLTWVVVLAIFKNLRTFYRKIYYVIPASLSYI